MSDETKTSQNLFRWSELKGQFDDRMTEFLPLLLVTLGLNYVAKKVGAKNIFIQSLLETVKIEAQYSIASAY
jgi:hypothetical protein